MIVKAMLKQDVAVEVTPNACIRALAQHFKVDSPLHEKSNIVYWSEKRDADGRLISLHRMMDDHNIDYYEETMVVHDKKSLRAYELLKGLEKLVHDDFQADERQHRR